MLRQLLYLMVLGAVCFAALTYLFATRPVGLKTSPLDFEITLGVGLHGASRQMVDAGIDMPAWQFAWFGRVLGRASQIKAGSYEVEAGVTPWQLLQKLTRGDINQGEVVLIEGKTFADFRQLLDNHPDIRHESAGMRNAELLAKLGIDVPHPEGLFFPDTYLFPKNASDLDIYRRAHLVLSRRLEAEWNSRAADLPYRSSYEALIMASIIEKETGLANDREQIAAVFINRLRSGMLLQTDPTVIYGLHQFDGNLHKKDLQADTPYNTYLRSGLPPTPIALPGQSSLHAALHPAVNDNYYFVARGDGSSVFSRTLEEHNRAVARYQKRKENPG
ncbi:Endolytic murein transglycosylase [Georgfuchsia toluolica]|uniref:Endolytic murein transglycosylase n=1 Tax=Georgfuchsia toluolica TaxID=424218 RepID=A0A916MZD8_9PROT|nr:endolytic transglycosylase MltG [Georgfuchsia toluolica]CAG4882846.1 Endolytic murein transglycosylase [Georgfuchsia toluolica]